MLNLHVRKPLECSLKIQPVHHDPDELQRMIMAVMINIKSSFMCGFDEFPWMITISLTAKEDGDLVWRDSNFLAQN